VKKTDKIFLAGHSGLVGGAILKSLNSLGFKNIILASHSELDLTDQTQVNIFFNLQKPKYVILAAAKVGGIYANNSYPAQFIYENIMIAANVIHASFAHKVSRLLFLGSTCIYPRLADQPIHEDLLLTGLLEPTNEPYAIAKIAGIKLCESYNREYKTDFRSVMPTNLYGYGDNFHLENSHVIPALIRKMHLAKCIDDKNWDELLNDLKKYPLPKKLNYSNISEIIDSLREFGITSGEITSVEIWGTGEAKREFMFIDDMAEACLHVMRIKKQTYHENTSPMVSHVNIGVGKDISIREAAETIKEIVGFRGELIYNSNKPDGAPRKLTNISRLKKLGWKNSTEFIDGIRKTYEWYCA